MLATIRNLRRATRSLPDDVRLALLALRGWAPRQAVVAVLAAAVVGTLIGVPTVLIPNSLFTREIPVTPWAHPVWALTSVLAGLLVATYVRPRTGDGTDPGPAEPASRTGMAGGVLTWFAVGCPVCNKLVLLALGSTGAMTWFAPLQPLLAAVGVALTAAALVVRLRGQVACPVREVARA